MEKAINVTAPAEELASAQEPSQSTQPETNVEAGESTQNETSLPEKFRGKSAEDIYKSYAELESYKGRIESEKVQRERELEQERARRMQLEQMFQSQQHMQSAPPVEEDPLESIDENEMLVNPKAALKKVIEHNKKQQEKIAQRLEQQTRAHQAQSRYEQLRKENPDFAELEPEMQQLAQQFAPLVRPDFINSPQMIDALYNLAKGKNVEKFVQAGKDKQQQARNLVRDEKRQAFSESSKASSSGSAKVDPADMSLEELARSIGRVDR